MNLFSKIRVNFSLVNLCLAILIFFTCVLSYFYWKGGLSDKWSAVVGGAVVASFTAIFQYIISYLDYRNNERLAISGVVNFLTSRDDKSYYSNLIENADVELQCLFYTSKRFCEDFCTEGGGDGLLIDKLNSKPELKVKIIIQEKASLPTSQHLNFDIASGKLQFMMEKFPGRFQVKTYKHIPTHNLFMTDKDAVIGPYFYNKNGKYSHSIHFRSDASYVKDFKTYFNEEWADANNYN